MVWGCFIYYGLGKLIILPKNKTVNSASYLDLLKSNLKECYRMCRIQRRGGWFMQDGAPPHTAKIVKAWLAESRIDYFKDWPGNSPDLNPIENLWAIIKYRLRACDTSSIPKLIRAVNQI